MTFRAVDVASYLVQHAIQAGRPITQLQLQKLIVIAHGYSLALIGHTLVNEPIEAWRHGPVISNLYNHYREFGSKPITTAFPEGDAEQIPEGPLREILDIVFDRYGSLSGGRLIELTHQQHTPWQKTYQPNRNNIIPNDLIALHYRELLQNV